MSEVKENKIDVKTEELMRCEKCGSAKFYIRGVDITSDYDMVKLTKEEVKDSLIDGNFTDWDYFKGYSQVKCSNCEDVIIDLS